MSSMTFISKFTDGERDGAMVVSGAMVGADPSSGADDEFPCEPLRGGAINVPYDGDSLGMPEG